MIRESLPPAAVVKPALPATSELDLERWPRWIFPNVRSSPQQTFGALDPISAYDPEPTWPLRQVVNYQPAIDPSEAISSNRPVYAGLRTDGFAPNKNMRRKP